MIGQVQEPTMYFTLAKCTMDSFFIWNRNTITELEMKKKGTICSFYVFLYLLETRDQFDARKLAKRNNLHFHEDLDHFYELHGFIYSL